MTTFNQFLGSEMLTEGYFAGKKQSAILPASRVLFGKNKVTPNHATSKAAGIWGDGPQSVMTYKYTDWKPSDKHGNGGGDVEKTFHVSSYGHYNPESPHHTKIGAEEHFVHDQTRGRLPSGKLVGASNYTDGVKVGHHGEDHSETKAALHVYK